MPLILAFDAAADRCAAALFQDDALLAAREETMARGHAERLFPMIEECLAEADRSYSQLDLIAVGTGPGNFTGARVGVAAARGIALSTGARAVGVDRFEALAEGREGALCVALAARGGSLHCARFENGAEIMAATVALAEAVNFARGALVVGDAAAALVAATGESRADEKGEPGEAPLSALARAALRKAEAGAPRPAPRYLRPANAAPMRPAPPIIE